jgi:DNA-binding NarL/FixJ family response regulator
MYVAASLRDDQAETLCFVLGFIERGRERLGFKASPTEAPRIAATTGAVTSRVDASTARRAFAAGRLASFEDAIARIAALKPGVVSVKRFERFAGLSNREREIAERVAAGKTNRQIAADLVVSVRTVDHHVASIFRKLGIQKREELE